MRYALFLFGALCACFTAGALRADEAPTPGSLSIGVVSFVGEARDITGPEVARILAERLAARPLDRMVTPDRLEVSGDALPEASEVRRMAEMAQVRSLVVGRVGEGATVELEVELRSGHSGVATSVHRVAVESRAALEAQLDELAAAILGDLGYEPPQVSATGGEGGDEEAGSEFRIAGLRNDQPIAINSDELEVVEQDGERHLLFKRNVRVVQGDIRLRTDRLEAFYEKGASRPRRLTATGHVRVDQGDREAHCERAIYLRDERVLRCLGSAELRDGCDRVRGGEIEFDLAQERVRVIGAASVLISPEGDEKCPGDAG